MKCVAVMVVSLVVGFFAGWLLVTRPVTIKQTKKVVVHKVSIASACSVCSELEELAARLPPIPTSKSIENRTF